MKVLSQYSKSKNITNLNDTTQKEYLESALTQEPITPPNDYFNPYTFDQWFNRQIGIIGGSEKQQYDLYLKNWYKNNYTPEQIAFDLKTDYQNFLKDLTLSFNSESNINITDINWNDRLEVEQAIPFFAKKLKEIAIYLVNKRDAIKKAKLKYNMTGATQALEKLFYEYLLKAFTQRDYVVNVPELSIFSQFPYLSDIKNDFRIEVQELYDNESYFDKDPTLSAVNYFTTTDATVTAYYDTFGINPTAYEWLFKTGCTELCANNPLFWVMNTILTNELPLSAIESSENPVLIEYLKFKLAQKYLGENQYYVSGGYYIPWETTVTFNLNKGNNWFYWPSGEYLNEISTQTIDSIPIVSSALIENGATGSVNYLSSDKIFIRYANTVSGAWLKNIISDTQFDIMSAKLLMNQTNIFRFPFPGYGLSGDGVEWSGKQLSNIDHLFDYLSIDIQNEIKKRYWTETTNTSSLCSILINESHIIDSGATAGNKYNESDHISIRLTENADKIHDTNPNNVYQSNMKHAWLYKMEKTDIPIARQQNYISWPIERYTPNTTILQPILSSQCVSMALSAIPIDGFIGSRAGTGLYDSDIIYKLDSRNGSPIECAYLEGNNINQLGGTTFTANATGAIQSSLALKCKAGDYTTFIWMDDDTDIRDTIIKHVPHQPDCPYLTITHHSLAKENPSDQKDNIDYHEWEKCECKSILYSPLGHPGATYDEYRNMADVIFLDTLYPIPYTSNVWVGMDGNNYQTSEDFAWFRLNSPDVEPDVGWGRGQWVAGGIPNENRRFILKKGYQYKYLRANLGHNSTYLTDNTVPYMIIKQPYYNVVMPQWKRALVDTEGNWQIDNPSTPTDMIINPGDYLVYDHIDSNWYCITSVGTLGSTLYRSTSTINIGNNLWINFNYVTSGQNIRLLWPNTLYNNGPSALAFQLSSVSWTITFPNLTQATYTLSPTEVLEIYADRYGEWKVTAVGNYINGGTITYSNVANFNVVPLLDTPVLSGTTTIETIYADTINTSLNIELSGWNYINKTYDGVSKGARPFWAYASDQDDKITKHKGIDIWGGGIRIVDDYTFITQPEPSDIEFEMDTYLEYTPQSNVVWIEPLTFNVHTSSNQWKSLIIDTTRVATVSDFLYNINTELIVSGTDVDSSLYLNTRIDDFPVFVNYWAINPFQWTQTITNSTLGLPPTGGVFVPIVTGELISAIAPYMNLTNRHYPTIATVPHVERLYNTEDVGGYFIPSMLGISTFLSKDNYYILNTENQLSNHENRGLSAVYRDVNSYTSDYGLTQKFQISPISGNDCDASWMKGNITQGKLAGQIIDPLNHQEFISYKTKYETTHKNHIGLRQQGDEFDPWSGEFDSTWTNNTNWPPDFKKQYNIDNWLTQFPQNKYVWQWSTDLFGNQYALLKTLSGLSIYEKRQAIGEFWIRNTNNYIQPASTILSGFFDNYAYITQNPPLSDEIYQIQNFEIFYDTLLVKTPNYILTNKISFDYDTGSIDFDINNIHVINLQENNNRNKFAGHWFFEFDKSITLALLVSSISAIYPRLYNLDLDSNDLTIIYNTPTNDTNSLSVLSLTSIEDPLFTYNNATQNYNMVFIGYSQNYESFILNNIFINDSGDIHTLNKVTAITPLK